jgi:hypothetical protein
MKVAVTGITWKGNCLYVARDPEKCNSLVFGRTVSSALPVGIVDEATTFL